MPSTQPNSSSSFDSSAERWPKSAHDRVGDGVGVVDQNALELGQIRAAFLAARIGVAEIGGALQREDALRFVLDDLDAAELCSLSHRSSSV